MHPRQYSNNTLADLVYELKSNIKTANTINISGNFNINTQSWGITLKVTLLHKLVNIASVVMTTTP